MNVELEKSIVSILQQTELYNQVLHEQKNLGAAVLDNAIYAFTSQPLSFENGVFEDVHVKAHKHQNHNEDKKDGESLSADPKQGDENKGENQGEDQQEDKENKEQQAQQPPSDESQAPQNAIESPNQDQQVNITTEHLNRAEGTATGNLSEGHSEELPYIDFGLPYLQNSVPRDLNIFHDFSPFVPRYFQLVTPQIESAAPLTSEGPCCSNPIPISIYYERYYGDGGECSYLSYGLTQDNIAEITSLLNSSFKFTFESFCDDGSADILFKQVGGGAYIYAGEGGVLVDPIENNPSVGDSYKIEVVQPSSDSCYYCCEPLSCDNPITGIEIDLSYYPFYYYGEGEGGTSLAIPCIDFFTGSFGVPVGFFDSYGNEWALVNSKENFQLVCMSETETAPIVFDLHNSGFQLSSAQSSNVMMDLKGYNGAYSAHMGWVGPDNGILTYDYSGSGAISSKNYILTENVAGAKTDLQALEVLAGQNHGIIDNSNSIWSKLGMWVDGNQNGKMDTGEYQTMSQLGITGINLTQIGGASQLNGNTIHSVISFNYADGTSGKAADVTLKLADVIQNNQSIIDDHSSTTATTTSTAAQTVIASAASAPVAPLHTDAAVQSAVEAVTTQQHPVS